MNKNSGGYNTRLANRLKAIADKHQTKLFETQSRHDLERLFHSPDHQTSPPEVIILIGGDGTVIAALDIILRDHPFTRLPHFIAIAGGTTNMIHRDIGHVMDAKGRVLEQLLLALSKGTLSAHPRPTLQITELTPDGHPLPGSASHCGFFFALGALPAAIHQIRGSFHQMGMKTGWRGKLGESLAALMYLWRLLCKSVTHHPVLYPRSIESTKNITTDKIWQKQTCIFAFATTLDSLILGIKPRRSKKNKHFLWAVLRWPYFGLIRDLARFRQTLPTTKSAIDTKEPTPPLFLKGFQDWMLDGEIHTLPAGHILKLDIHRKITFLRMEQ